MQGCVNDSGACIDFSASSNAVQRCDVQSVQHVRDFEQGNTDTYVRMPRNTPHGACAAHCIATSKQMQDAFIAW